MQMCDPRLRAQEAHGLRVGVEYFHPLLLTPSVFSSHFAEDFEDAEGFGWEKQETRKHDWKKLVANKVSGQQPLFDRIAVKIALSSEYRGGETKRRLHEASQELWSHMLW